MIVIISGEFCVLPYRNRWSANWKAFLVRIACVDSAVRQVSGIIDGSDAMEVMRWKRRDRMNYSEKTQQEIIEEIQALRRQLSDQQRAFEESEARYRNLF
ncbi:MAG TPA: hypothetical protein VJZ27_06445, partial [Aggregatilineales bacterium]|nr:hypothetical protein [Aggregatilineales bacterium]